MKAWRAPQRVRDYRGFLSEEKTLPLASQALCTLERVSLKEARRAMRGAVRAYARDPSQHNASRVEVAITTLRQHRPLSRP